MFIRGEAFRGSIKVDVLYNRINASSSYLRTRIGPRYRTRGVGYVYVCIHIYCILSTYSVGNLSACKAELDFQRLSKSDGNLCVDVL